MVLNVLFDLRTLCLSISCVETITLCEFHCIFHVTMGCSVGKLNDMKLKSSPTISSNDMKIQTVLHFDIQDSKPLKDKSLHKYDRVKKNKHNDPRVKRKTEAHKSPRPRCEKPQKTGYDLKIITKYDMKGMIGKGSCSYVVRVEHRISKQPYALKIIDVSTGQEAFEAEFSILRRLNHPNVIKLTEMFESNQQMYMVMDLATGGSLLDRLEARGYLGEDESRDVMKMVLKGVQYLHSLGIAHRDLKPDNLLYYHPGKDSRLMITDFSFASTRKPSGSPYMHTVCGTPQYIAPEIVMRKPYTNIVDMWAVGIITYIVLCGEFPFDAEVDSQIFKLILQGQIDMSNHIWKDVSEKCKSFIHQLLRISPDVRLTATVALHHPWILSPILTPPRGSNRNERRSTRSGRSVGSNRSASSIRSIRASGHRRVRVQHLEALCKDPEVAALM